MERTKKGDEASAGKATWHRKITSEMIKKQKNRRKNYWRPKKIIQSDYKLYTNAIKKLIFY